jgi:hypothetical protein
MRCPADSLGVVMKEAMSAGAVVKPEAGVER